MRTSLSGRGQNWRNIARIFYPGPAAAAEDVLLAGSRGGATSQARVLAGC